MYRAQVRGQHYLGILQSCFIIYRYKGRSLDCYRMRHSKGKSLLFSLGMPVSSGALTIGLKRLQPLASQANGFPIPNMSLPRDNVGQDIEQVLRKRFSSFNSSSSCPRRERWEVPDIVNSSWLIYAMEQASRDWVSDMRFSDVLPFKSQKKSVLVLDKYLLCPDLANALIRQTLTVGCIRP